MVQSILAGDKSETRRLNGLDFVNEAPSTWTFDRMVRGAKLLEGSPDAASFWRSEEDPPCIRRANLKCPYGAVGDFLWVRETWFDNVQLEDAVKRPMLDDNRPRILYRADGEIFDQTEESFEKGEGWKPSIHMPRWASRILLKVTDVRVERLQSISGEDVTAEGVKTIGEAMWGRRWHLGAPPKAIEDARDLYRQLWEKINGKGSWDANPWVWVVSFEVVDQKGADQ
ncbi:hypothetical protein EON81_07920 [bacterium]|nr:MAG: hypothetical protein EON81_07920 [bacterium]